MAEANLSGRILADRYRVEEKLAFGGMAEVWLAWDLRVERRVVLKVPYRHLLSEPSFRQRFTREIRSLVGLKHANIVLVLDVGDLDGLPFFVMDYLDGGSLQDRLESEGSLTPGELTRWLPGIADALDSVHGDGLIHRDVKPGNILFNRGGDAFLADFGLTKAFEETAEGLTKSGVYPGSPAYMPPDILTGDILPAYDQYALAAVVMHAVTGTAPAPLRAHVGAADRLGDVLPPDAKSAVLRALSIEVGDRFGTCRAFAEAFRAGLGETAITPVPAPPGEPEPAKPTPPGPSEEDLEREAERLRKRWEEELERLKNRVGKRRDISGFVLLGAPGAGKTTLLSASGLDPGVPEEGVSSGFWTGADSVVFETRTRGSHPESEWTSFLSLTGSRAVRHAVHGGIAAVSADVLLTSEPERIREEAGRIRQRLGELAKRELPVHLVVTKCDLVPGFTEFFDALGSPADEELMGFAAADGAGTGFRRAAFEERFGALVERLFRVRCMAEDTSSPEALLRSFLFPEEFARLGRPLAEFQEALGESVAGLADRTLEGVWFVSGTQPEGERRSRPYFVRGLLSRRVLGAPKAPPDLRKVRRRRRLGTVATAAVVLAGVFVTWAFVLNRSRLAEAEAAVTALSAVPLDAACGLLRTENALIPRNPGDFGLSRTDRVRPALRREFRRVFERGCLRPLLEDIGSRLAAGPEKAGDAVDLRRYLVNWDHLLYLRAACAGELVPFAVDGEAPYLEQFLVELRLRGFVADASAGDLRAALAAYGSREPNDEMKKLIARLEWEYAGQLNRFLDLAESWARGNEKKLERGFPTVEAAIEQLRRDCARSLPFVDEHGKPEEIVALAGSITAPIPEADPSWEPRPPGDLVRGVSGVRDLRGLLTRLLDSSPDPEISRRLVALLERIGSAPGTKTSFARYHALEEVRRYFADLEPPEPLNIEGSPDREELASLRTRIRDEIAAAESRAWNVLREPIETLEGGEIRVTIGGGPPVRKAGWWDTLILLAKARATDALMEEYLEYGLNSWLGRRDWYASRGQGESEVLTVGHWRERALPDLREQLEFFEDELVAASLREEARDLARVAFADLLRTAERHWDGELRASLPHEAPQSLNGAVEILSLSPKSELGRAAADIRSALSGILELGTEDDPLVEATVRDRRRLFEEFVICFDPGDDEVSPHATIEGAAGGPLGELAKMLSGPPGSSRSAREFFSDRGVEVLAASLDAARAFGKEDSESARRLGRLLEECVRVVTQALVKRASEEVNLRWAVVRAQLVAGGGKPIEEALGADGPFTGFFTKDLAPLFRNALPEGTALSQTPGFEALIVRLKQNAPGTYEAFWRTTTVPDRLELSPTLAGEAKPTSLRIEYVELGGRSVSSEEIRNAAPVKFTLVWSPKTCASLRFHIGYDRDRRHAVMEWDGPWAVAEALAEADREDGRFVWRNEDPPVEIRMDVRGRLRLLEIMKAARADPSSRSLDEWLPKLAVEIR